MQDNKSPEPTPDQLLKLLDVQIEMQRQKRKVTSRNRAVFRIGGIFLIIVILLGALLILQFALNEVPHEGRSNPASNAPTQPREQNF